MVVFHKLRRTESIKLVSNFQASLRQTWVSISQRMLSSPQLQARRPRSWIFMSRRTPCSH